MLRPLAVRGARSAMALDRLSEIGPGLRLEALPEYRGEIERLSSQEACEHVRATGVKDGVGNPSVLSLDLLLVCEEARWIPAQDGQVDVHEKSRVS